MESHEIIQLKELVPSIDQYPNEIKVIEAVLNQHQLQVQAENKAVFWNHFVSLFARIDQNEQNELECDDQFQASQEARLVTKTLVQQLNAIRVFTVTAFEEFLILIYMEKLIEERKENHE